MKKTAFLNFCILVLAPFSTLHAGDDPKPAGGLPPSAAAEQAVGNYGSHTVTGNTIVFNCLSGTTVRVELCQAGVARIRMAVPGADFVANEDEGPGPNG
jgi:hypothetical protein